MKRIWNVIAKLWRHRQEATKEFTEAAEASIRMWQVLEAMETLPDQLRKALADGNVDNVERENLVGRLEDLVKSGYSTMNEVHDALLLVRRIVRP